MTDILLEIGRYPQARSLIKSLGLPLPMPEHLRRERGAYQALPLKDKQIAIGGSGALIEQIAEAITSAGADAYLLDPALASRFADAAAAHNRPAREIDKLPEKKKLDAIVFDASSLHDTPSLSALYEAFHPAATASPSDATQRPRSLLERLSRSGRVVILGRPYQDAANRQAAQAQAALEGFTRSLAKEIGRLGATANLLLVEEGAETRLLEPLRFFLSPRSAFVSAQPLQITKKAQPSATLSAHPTHRLEKKIALVTGAARGIGEATAHALAKEGAHVVCLDRPDDDAALSVLARQIGGTPLGIDLTDDDAPEKIAAALLSLGGVDIVVHNAGITRDKTLARMKPAAWDLVLAVNLHAVERLHQRLLQGVLRPDGRVICLSSVAGIAGNVGQTAYAASKAGILGFVHHAAQESAAQGITINAIAPGFIETRLTAAIPLAIREAGRRLSALSQGGLPEDIAQSILFLALPRAHGVTGEVLRVCGGALIGA